MLSRLELSNSLLEYSKTIEVNKFGGRFKFSKVVTLIDQSDPSNYIKYY